MITKTDFLLFLDAPRHLWAKKNGRISQKPSDFDTLLRDQGYEVEALAKQYLLQFALDQNRGQKLDWQVTVSDGIFEVRSDAIIYKPEEHAYDLYEIKSSTAIENATISDVTFQTCILCREIPLDNLFVVHLNKGYQRKDTLDLSELFVVEDVSSIVDSVMPAVEILRNEAQEVVTLTDPETIPPCLNPNECPCIDVCHPNLPEFSIYDIPRLSKEKKARLLEDGIEAAKDIPATIELSKKQKLIVDCAKTDTEYIDYEALSSELGKISYPVYFLDYETCISAIPKYPGYHPQQQIVFQYSLHRLDEPGGEVSHFEHITITKDDPSLPLLEKLSTEIRDNGSIIVWNKTFEMTRNKEMADIHPQFAVFLNRINERIYDLSDVVNKGIFIHPGFKGSWSIKKVLPTLIPHLSYDDLNINKGDQASITWWNLCFGNCDEGKKAQLSKDLLHYCELDTLAMVEIYRYFKSLFLFL